MTDSTTRGAKILVVDDNEQNRALAEATLVDEGHEVVLASNGEEALRAFERDKPDCVLLDVRMPGLDGFAVCERMRALPGGDAVPMIFVTALRDVETFDRARLAGADDFLTKPVRPAELVVRVQSALRLRRMGTELRDVYEHLRQQRDDLTRLGLQKEMLTAFVVHDLKNPVGAIDLLAQALVRDRTLSADARDSAAQIRESARRMMRLIHNLLDISKSEEGKLAPERAEVDLHALAAQLEEAFEAQARDASVTLETAMDAPSVRADLDLLRRVLENLLENAVRHAPKQSVVRLSASPHGDGVEVRVTDHGQGVPPEMRERIFDRFVQLDHASQGASRAGRGLGLTFVKLAVEAHGGRVWIEDAAPGTSVCVRLPNER